MNALTVLVGVAIPLMCSGADSRWAEMAQSAASRIQDSQQQYVVWPVLASLHARCGQVDRSIAALGRISDAGLRQWALDSFVAELAAQDDLKSARSVLATVKDRDARNSGLFSVAVIAAEHQQFGEAEAIADSMDHEALRQDLLAGLAGEEAKSGQYDKALDTAKKYHGSPPFAERERRDLHEFIERCRKEGRRQEATHIQRTLRDVIYATGDMPLVPTAESAAIHKTRVNDRGDPASRTVSAFLLARWYKHYNDRARCEEMLAVARKAVLAVPHGPDRLLDCTYIVEMMVDLGQREAATKFAREMLPRDEVTNAVRQPDTGGLAPRIVAAYALSGLIDEAFATARDSAPDWVRDEWWVLGAICAMEGKTGEIERRLPSVTKDWQRSLLSAGVAIGLHELRQPAKAAR